MNVALQQQSAECPADWMPCGLRNWLFEMDEQKR